MSSLAAASSSVHSARAQDRAPAASQAQAGKLEPALGLSLGAATFLYARSFALEHRLRPFLRASYNFSVAPRLTLGPALAAVLDTDPNYGVWSAYGAARYSILVSTSFELGALLGLGIGYDAPILHRDLKADGVVIPYAELSVDGSWKIGKNWAVGVAAGVAQISVVHLSSTVSGQF